MKNDDFEKEYIEKPKRSTFLPSVSVSRLHGSRLAGVFMLFICLLLGFIIGLGLHRSEEKPLTASAADDWGATWNAAVTASSAENPQTVKLTSAWTTTSDTKTGTGFNNNRIYVPPTKNVILDLNGYTINRGLTAVANYGNVFYVEGTLTLRGSGYVRGGYVNGNVSSAYGGGIYIGNGGVVNIEGPTIGPNKTSVQKSAGGVYVASGGTLNLKSGNIGNSGYANEASAANSAGGVYVASGGTFNMTGGYVRYNTASATASGAGAYVVSGGTFNMTGGYIRNNTASGTYSGAGVYLDGTMQITGGQIGHSSTQSSSYYNNATNSTSAGGVYYTANGKLSVGGSGTIYYNVSASTYTKDILFASATSKIKVVSNFSGTSYRYGVYKTGTGTFTSGLGSNSSSVFVVQNTGTYKQTTLIDNDITEVAQLNKTNMAENWSYFVQKSLDTNTQQTMTLDANWTASSGSMGTGTGFNNNRIYVPAGANIILNLNGYTIDRGLTAATNYGNTFYVCGTLTVNGNTSSYVKGAFTNGYYGTSRGAAFTVSGGTLNLNGGIIGSNRITSYSTSSGYSGAPIYVTNGTVNMTGGYIGNSTYPNTSASGTYNAGGVCVGQDGVFNMSGGYITYNTASYTYNAGGVCVMDNGTFNMTGGYIRNNTASNATSGGGVYLSGAAKATLTGGDIGHTSSTSYANNGTNTTGAGGMYVASGATLEIGGSIKITNNSGTLAPNLYFASPTGKAKVVSAFSSAKIGVIRNGYADNYAVSGDKRNFTTNYSGSNNTASPTTFFTADGVENGVESHTVYLADNEASLECKVGYANWSYAVARSLADKSTQTVTLYSNWTGVSLNSISGNLSGGFSTGFSQGRMYLSSGATIVLSLNGFSINRGLTAANNYGSVITVDGTLTIKGNANSMISGGYSNNYSSTSFGGGLHITGTGVVNMEGGVIAKNTTTSANSGGGVYVADGGVFHLKGGYIGKDSSNYNTATNSSAAGGVYVANGGKFTMDSSVTTSYVYYNRANAASSGAGVYVAGSRSVFNMEAGYMRYNTAAGATSGGGVYLNGTMKLSGGQIGRYDTTGYGNTASNTSTGAGGIYYAGGSLSVGGTTCVYNNVSGSTYGKDIRFAKEDLKITVDSALANTSYKFGIYKTGVGAFTKNYGTYNSASYYNVFFTNYNSSYTLSTETLNSVLEVALTSTGAAENWSHAIQRSLDINDVQTVTLTQNWNATSGSFGDGTGYSSGRLYVPAGAKIILNLNGYSVNRGLTAANNYGSVFYICGTLTIQGNTSSYIRGGYANAYYSSAYGGGAHIANGGVLNLASGIFAGNRSTASSYGAGGVYVASGGTFNMSGGYIGYSTTSGADVTLHNYNYCSSSYGAGGVMVRGGGTFNMTSGYIYGNTAAGSNSAGGVYLCDDAVMTMKSGRIGAIMSDSSNINTYRNIANGTGSAGGVYVSSTAKISIGGSYPSIDNNTGALAPNLYFASATGYATIIGGFSGNTSGSSLRYVIGVTRNDYADNYAVSAAQRNITKDYSQNTSASATAYFRADDTANHVVQLQDGEVILHCKKGNVNWSNAVKRSLADKSTQTVTLEEAWTAVSGSLQGPYSTGFSQGRIYLPSGASVVLDLASYSIDRALGSVNNYGNVFYVCGTLTLKGSGGSYVQGGYTNCYYTSSYGGGFFIASGGTLNMEGSVTIRKNITTHSYSGAGVYVAGGAIFNFRGGYIGASGYANNATNTYSAGGVYVASDGVFNMTSASANIQYNTASSTSSTYSGGGVYVAGGGKFNMTNGYIRYNTAAAAYSGGGVYLAGNMQMTGGRIGHPSSTSYSNTASLATGAGGLYYASSGSLSVGGDVAIANNITVSSYTKDIVFASESLKIKVVQSLTDSTSSSGYRFGIYKTGVGAFTSGYGTYSSNATSYYNTTFRSQNSAYTLSTLKVNNVTEVAFTSVNGTENWSQAVQTSLDKGGSQETVTLTQNWNATSHSSYVMSFGTTTGYLHGRIYVPAGANVVLDLNGYSVNRGLTSAYNYGSVFYVQGTLTIRGGNTSSVIKGGYANGYYSTTRGGGIHIEPGGIVNFVSGVIGSNKSNSQYGGGGVYVANGATFNMSGGFIGYDTSTPNYAYGQNSGAGVYVASGGTFNMTGGSVRCNISSGSTSAGGIYASGIVKITNGQIGYYYNSNYPNKGNGTNNAGGIYVVNGASLSLGGGNIAVNNNTGTLAPNVYFANATAKATIVGSFNNSNYKVGVKRAGYADNYATNTNRNFTSNWSKFNTTDPTNYFVCNDTDNHKVIQSTDKEGAFECLINSVNWSNAVKQSQADGLQKTVNLTSDWAGGGTFTSANGDSTGYSQGRLNVPAKANIVLNLKGYTLNRGLGSANNYGSVFYVVGTLVIDGNGSSNSIVRGGYANCYYSSTRGGGIHIANGGNVTLKGSATLRNNTVSGSYGAGGVYVADGATFTLQSANIHYNYSTNTYSGAGVYVAGTGTFNMESGTIYYNRASGNYSAGGVYLADKGTLTMTAGQIGNYNSSNTGYANVSTPTNGAGGVYVASGGILNVGGTANICNNGVGSTVVYNTRDVYLVNSTAKINVISKHTNSNYRIGVYRTGNGIITSGYGKAGNTSSPSTFYVSENTTYSMLSEGTGDTYEGSLLSSNNAENWSYAVKQSQLNKGAVQTVTLTKNWTATSGSFGSGTGYSQGRLYVPSDANITLNLNGYTIDRALTSANNYGSVFYIAGTLTIQGNSSSYIRGGYANGYYSYTRGAGIHIYDNGTVNMEGGAIVYNRSTGSYGAGGVFVSGGATFNMTGGYIGMNASGLGNSASGSSSAGGVLVYDRGKFTMQNGCYIYNNSSTGSNSAGAVRVSSNATFEMSGGYIGTSSSSYCYNTASGSYSAGGVYLVDGTFKMTGGNFRNNRATGSYSAGGVFVNGGTFEMTGGYVGSSNTSYANYASNSTGTSVGGVYVNTNGKISLGGTAYINNNQTSNGTVSRYTGNLFFVNATRTATIVSPFTSGARINLYRTASVTTQSDGSPMTSGFSAQNGSALSTNYFYVDMTLASGSTDYILFHENGEAYLYNLDPVTNWQNAVNNSSTSTPKTFKLFANWTAGTNSSWGTAFSPNSGSTSQPFYQGTLNVPSGKSVILDLNGYTLSRGLTAAKARSNGYVLGVRGTLKIIDSSASKNGIIKGGSSNSTGVGSGIHVVSGTLTLEGGRITDNYGSYGVYVNSSSVINMGGDIGVYNNKNASGNPANVFMNSNDNRITIVSAFTSKREIGISRITSAPHGVFTSQWGTYHDDTVDPEDHFYSDDLNFRIGTSGAGSQTEVAILGNDNASNWQYAVTTSLKTKQTCTVELMDNWSASKNSSYGTAFGINTTAYYYGALYVPSGASIILDLKGFTIDRKLTTGNVFNIVGKLQIIDSSAGKTGTVKGGSNGIYIYNGGTVIMNAGKVTGNASYGVYDYNGTFTMTGGTVRDNTGTSVYVERNGRINLGGTAVIDNGTDSGNLVLAYESTVIGITSKFQEGASVSLLRKGVGQLTSNWGKYNPNVDPWEVFTSESAVYLSSTEEVSGSLEAFLISYDNNINWQYTVSTSLSTNTTKSMQLYSDWLAGEHATYTTAFGTTSAYLNGALYVPKGASVVLDLSGYDVNRGLSEARANGYVIYVQGELRIFDSHAKESEEGGAVITGGMNSSGSSAGAVYVAAGGVFTLADAQIVSNNATSDASGAGAVYTAGTFNFTSGVISGNAGASAGGVYIANAGVFNMADGTTIEGNAANGTAGGGAVYAAGAFALKGGEISANTGTAGGVYVAGGGNFTFESGKITNNNGTLAGGVYVYNSTSANFAMSGGELSQNSTSDDKSAGGIYVAGGKLVITGGSVTGNHAENDGTTAGGVFVASAGTVTMTGGSVCDNTGTNGFRAEGAATVNLGGTAKIADNYPKNGNGIDVYMTDGTRAINIVSKFEDGAEIGIWRDAAGSFTKGYGIYNGAASGAIDPNNFFYSNKQAYNVFQTEAEVGESVEVAAGILATRPYAIGADDVALLPVYNGSDQLHVAGYDAVKMTVGDLPEGVKLTAEGFVATHAGTYKLTFTLGSDYCWSNGTVTAYQVSGVIAPKPVELAWSDLEFTYDAAPHKPTAQATNLIGNDTCTVTVTKEETNADTYTATASALSNSDYTVERGVNVTHSFVINKAPMTLNFKETTAVYKQGLTLALDGNVEGGTVTYSVENKAGKAEIQGTDVLMPTWVGDVTVTANVTETRNYLAGTVSAVFTIEQADAPLELAVKEAFYGTPLTLSVTDYGEVGALTFTVEENKTGEAQIASGSDVLQPLAVGTVDIRVTVAATHNYKETSVVNTLTVKPRVVTLSWTDLEFVYDGDPHCAKAEITNLVGSDTCNLQIAGAQTDAGTYDATVKSLDNDNYTLNGAAETTKQFVIHKANISPVVNTTAIVFKQAQQIDVEGNLGSGAVTLKVLEGGTGNATAAGDTLTGTWVGTIDVEVKIAETKNYLGATLTVSIEVTPADPEIDLAVKEAVYGTDLTLTVTGNEENATVHYSLEDGETKASLSGAKLDIFTPHDIGNVTVKIYAEPTHNYKEGNFTVTVTVKARPVTVIWTKLVFDYDGNEHAPEATITGLVEGDSCTVNVLGAQINAGTHTAMADSLGNDKYTLIGGTDVTTKFTINACPVNLSWNDPDFTYNGEIQTPEATVTNLIGDDKCTITVLGTKIAGTNLLASATGVSNPNYTLDGGTNLVTTYAIKPLPVELEWSNTTLVYSGTEQKPTATVKNLCGSDKCEVTVIGAQTNVGKYTATAFSVSNPNYTVQGGSELSSPYEIVRAPISLKLVDDVLTYGTEATLAVDGNLGNGTVTFTVVNGTGTATSSGSYIFPTKVGDITVTASVEETANYEHGSVTATVNIQPRRVTLRWEEGKEYVYNGDEQAPNATVADLVTIGSKTDECEVRVSGQRDVGKDLVATATSLTNENYTLLGCTTLTTTFAIVPLRAELEWSNFTLVYNGKEQAPTATVTNRKGTDACEVTVAGETDVGINLVASAISLSNPNYTLDGTTNLTATFTITALVAQIVWTDTKLTYNGTEQAPTATVGNLCEGDSCIVTVSGGQENAGIHTATAASLSNPNYTLTGATNVSTTFVIEQAERQISLLEAQTVYGTALSLTLLGNSENGSVTYVVAGGTGSATINDSGVLTPTRAGEVMLSVTVAATKNYKETKETLTVTVTPKPIGITWTNTEFTYDGTEKKPTATATGLIGSDSCEVIVSGGQTDAGTHTAQASGVVNPNYTLEGVEDTTSSFTINKANITLTITSTRTSYGIPMPIVLEGNLGNGEVTYTVTDETGSGTVDGKGVFTGTGFGTVTVTAEVAESKNYNGGTTSAKIVIDKGPAPLELVTPTAVYGKPYVIALSGGDEDGKFTYTIQEGTGTATLSGNMMLPTKVGTVTVVVKMSATETFEETIKSFTVTIAPLPVQLAWAISDFTYNGTEQAPTATVSNLLDGDTCTVTVSGQTDAGTDQIAAATSLSNPNYTLEGSSTATTTFVIKPKVVTFDWGNTEFAYTGEAQAPTPTVSNLEGSDDCEVTVVGAEINAGDYTATVTEISNSNYTLEGAEGTSSPFHIDKVKITVGISTTEAIFGTDLKLETAGNIAGGEESFAVTPDTSSETPDTGTAEISGDTFIPKRVGTVTVTLSVGETQNTYGATAVAVITIKKGQVAVDLATKSTVYGTPLQLQLTGNTENGTFTYSIVEDTFATLSGTDTLVPLKAGTVTVRVVVQATTNFDQTQYEAQITIERLPVVLEWTDSVLVYNGKEQAPEVKVKNLVGEDKCELEIVGAKDAGTNLTATVKDVLNENYTLEGVQNCTQTFEIAPLKIELMWGETVFAYNGEAQTPKVTVLNLQGDDTEDDCKLTLKGAETAVGKGYTATVTGVSSGNYSIDGVTNLSTSFEITKGTLSIDILAGDVIYNVPIQLTVSGNKGGGAVTYKVMAGPASIDGDILTPTGIGETITVKAIVEETDNYFGVEAIANFNAAKTTADYKLVNSTVEYGNDLALTIQDKAGEVVVCEVKFKIEESSTGAAVIIGGILTPERVGTIDLTITVEETDTYLETTFTAQVFITAIVLEISWDPTEFVYTGEEQVPTATLTNLLTADVGKVSVVVQGAQVNAGENYTAIAVSLTGESAGNYMLPTSGNSTPFKIKKADIKLEITLLSIFCQERTEITVEGNLGGGNITFSISGGTGEATIDGNFITASKDGSVTVNATVEETQNYKGNTAQAVIVIYKKQLTLGLTVTEVIYGNSVQLVVTGNVENGAVTFTIDGDISKVSIDTNGVLKGTGAGTVNIIVSVADTPGYQASSTTVAFTVLQRPISGLSWTVPELVYNCKEQAPTATAAGILSGDECTVIVSGGKVNAGTYPAGTVTATSLSNPNYKLGTFEGASAPEFTIQKADLVNIGLVTSMATVNVPLKLEVSENDGGGTPSYVLVPTENTTGVAVINGDVLTGTQRGIVCVRISIPATTNYNAIDRNVDVSIEAPQIPLELVETETFYGTNLKLAAKGYESNVVRFTLGEGDLDKAEIDASTNTLIPKKAGTVKVILTVDESGDYKANTKEVEVVIKPRPIGVTWDNLVLPYNGTEQLPTVTFSNLVEGKTCNVSIGGAKIDAGKYTASITMLDDNYVFEEGAETSKEFEITARVVELEWTIGKYTYNGSEQKPTVEILNLVEEDECEITVEGQTDASLTATATVTNLSNNNYTLEGCVNATVQFVIGQKPVSVEWGETELIYNGNPQAPMPQIEGVLDGDKCEYTLTGAQKDVGSDYTATVESISNPNYLLESASSTPFTIKAYVLEIKADDLIKQYNGNYQKPDITIIPLNEDDDISVSIGGLTDGVYEVGKYDITLTLSGAAKGNYAIKEGQENLQFEITPKEITVRIQPKNVTLLYEGAPITADDIKDWYVLEPQDDLADADASIPPAELFADLAVKPVIKLGDVVLEEINENGIYRLTPDVSDEAVVCKNYALKLVIGSKEEDKYCDLIVNGESTDVIALKDGSNYQFLTKAEENDGYYRYTYAEMGWTHGVDDVGKIDRFVLGQVSPRTSINAFLNHLKSNKSVRIYSKDGKLLYDCGNPGEGISETDLGTWSKIRITTGSYVTLVKGNLEIDRVYVSVLGDVNCDGNITSADISFMVSYIRQNDEIPQTEILLAMLIENNGRLSNADVTQLGKVVTLKVKIEQFYYEPDEGGETEEEEEPTVD